MGTFFRDKESFVGELNIPKALSRHNGSNSLRHGIFVLVIDVYDFPYDTE